MKRWYMRTTYDKDAGDRVVTVYEYRSNDKGTQLSTPEAIKTFGYEWRAEKFIKEQYKEQAQKENPCTSAN